MARIITLLLIGLALSATLATATCVDCNYAKEHTTCVSTTLSATGLRKTVRIDVGGIKGSSISWMCARDAAVATQCSGSLSGGNKCDELMWMDFDLPIATTSIQLQAHDGQFGSTEVFGKGADSGACGGTPSSCGTASGVCTFTFDLSSCPAPATPVPQGCDCSNFPVTPCQPATQCVNGQCQPIFAPATTMCRGSAGICDVAEFCTGSAAACPADDFKPTTTECRGSAGICDVAEFCTGSAAACPADSFKPTTAVCRAADGDCDAVEFCTGTGVSCPADLLKPATAVCRAKADACDVADFCTGKSRTCPGNLRNDNGFSMKCGTTCYVCGAPTSAVHQNPGSKSAQSKEIGTGPGCVIGNCDAVVELPWPACTEQCIPTKCPNNKDLSNAALLSCVPSDGHWTCNSKYDGAGLAGLCQPWVGSVVPRV